MEYKKYWRCSLSIQEGRKVRTVLLIKNVNQARRNNLYSQTVFLPAVKCVYSEWVKYLIVIFC